MMRLPPFARLAPRTLAEAVEMLADQGPGAAVVAGGTDLYPNMKRRQVEHHALVDLRAVEGMRGIREEPGGGISIGATTRLSHLAGSSAVPRALAHAASVIASPQIRNMGTVGGNLCLDTRCSWYNEPEDWRTAVGFCLKAAGDVCRVAPAKSHCWAVASSDLPPVAIALGASVRAVGPGGERTFPVADLYRDDGIDHLALLPGEIVAELLVPPVDGLRVTYRKIRRRGSIDFPELGVAASVRLAPEGICEAATIVLGSVASAPVRCREAEDLLAGRPLTPEVIEEAAAAAAHPAKPQDNTDLSHVYRKWVIPIHVSRALQSLS